MEPHFNFFDHPKQQRAAHGSHALAGQRRLVFTPHGGDGAKHFATATDGRTLDHPTPTLNDTDADTYVLTLSSHAARQQTPRRATGIPANVNRLQYMPGGCRVQTHPTARSSFTAPAQRNSDDSKAIPYRPHAEPLAAQPTGPVERAT